MQSIRAEHWPLLCFLLSMGNSSDPFHGHWFVPDCTASRDESKLLWLTPSAITHIICISSPCFPFPSVAVRTACTSLTLGTIKTVHPYLSLPTLSDSVLSVLWGLTNCNMLHVQPQMLSLQSRGDTWDSASLMKSQRLSRPLDSYLGIRRFFFPSVRNEVLYANTILLRVKYSHQHVQTWTMFLRAVKGHHNMTVSIKVSMLTSLFQYSVEVPASPYICFSIFQKKITDNYWQRKRHNLSWCPQL